LDEKARSRVKIQHNNSKLETIIDLGLQQTAEYADGFNADETHLIIFNRDSEIPWGQKIWYQKRQYQQREIGVWGC